MIKNCVSTFVILGMIISLENPVWARRMTTFAKENPDWIRTHPRYVSRQSFKDSLTRSFYINRVGREEDYKGDSPEYARRFRDALQCNNPEEQLREALYFVKIAKKIDFVQEARPLGRAVTLLEKVIETKNIDEKDYETALYTLANIHGDSAYFEAIDSIPYYKKLKKRNHADAIYQLGVMHGPYMGYDYAFKEYSDKKVAEYYEIASKLGHRRASFELAQMYHKKQIFVKNSRGSMDSKKTHEKALYYYEIAACGNSCSPDESAGDLLDVEMMAQFDYGQILLRSTDTEERQKGRRLINLSAKKGHVLAVEHRNNERFKEARVLLNNRDIKEIRRGKRLINGLAKNGYEPAIRYRSNGYSF